MGLNWDAHSHERSTASEYAINGTLSARDFGTKGSVLDGVLQFGFPEKRSLHEEVNNTCACFASDFAMHEVGVLERGHTNDFALGFGPE